MTFLVPRKRRQGVSPLDDIFGLNQFDRLFSQLQDVERSSVTAALDVHEDEKNVYVELEVPGVDKSDIQIDYLNGILTVSGEKKELREEKKEGYEYREISRGSFKRSLNVGDIEFDQANASVDNGVLSITLPKHAAKQKRSLDIK